MSDFNRPLLLKELERDEGLRLKPYKDTIGKLTIGVGRNLDDVGITHQEAMELLANDVDRVTVTLDKHLPWWRSLSDARQRVLINMCFNMGWDNPRTPQREGLSGFVNTLSAIERGDYADAAVRMLRSKWARQVGQRAKRLSQMMERG